MRLAKVTLPDASALFEATVVPSAVFNVTLAATPLPATCVISEMDTDSCVSASVGVAGLAVPLVSTVTDWPLIDHADPSVSVYVAPTVQVVFVVDAGRQSAAVPFPTVLIGPTVVVPSDAVTSAPATPALDTVTFGM